VVVLLLLLEGLLLLARGGSQAGQLNSTVWHFWAPQKTESLLSKDSNQRRDC
jgi:hypothetical protein